MKTIIGAIALAIAVPAVAQTAPAADPHAQHQGMDHSQHQAAMHDCMECCEKMMQHHQGKMDCMGHKGSAQDHDGKSNHQTSPDESETHQH